jgi:hypothetical protein
MMDYTVKAILDSGEWDLDVLGCPYGGPNGGKDAQGEYFDSGTKFHEDKFGLPPAVYYHGFGGDGKPDSEPRFIGRTLKRWRDGAGEWFRVRLDKASTEAGRVWDAAKRGTARASSGAVAHLVRTAPDGRILHWPVAELSIFETDSGKRPANGYAVAMLAAKALWSQAGATLPDIAEPEAVAEGVDVSTQSTTGATPVTVTITDRSIKMSTEIEQAIAAAFAARDAEQARAAEQAEVARMKAELEALKATQVADNRIPGGGMPYVKKFGDLSKYDNLSFEDQAFLVGVLQAGREMNTSRGGASAAAVKALAIKAGESQTNPAQAAVKALLHAGGSVKANEVQQQDLASYGNEWVGVAYSNALWDVIRHDAAIAAKIPTIEVPAGMESVVIPLATTPPVFYKVAEATDAAVGELYHPAVTVTSSQMGTSSKTLSLAKLGCRVMFSGELEEDSLIPWVAELRRQIQLEGAGVLDSCVMDGDTSLVQHANINLKVGTAVAQYWTAFDGMRKSALVTTTANSRDAGAFTASDFTATLKLMGDGGMNALDQNAVEFIIGPNEHWAALNLPEVKTRDVFAMPTLEAGRLTSIYGYRVNVSANIIRATSNRLCLNTGYTDSATPGNNAFGCILAARFDQWRLGWRRRMTIETTRIPSSDATEIVALMRVGLAQRDTEASAVSYNLTVA